MRSAASARDRAASFRAPQGDMLGPLRHGRGEHLCSSGDRYEGAWRYDKRHGQGRLQLSRGVSYKGEWHEDMAEGYGLRCWQGL